MKRKTAIALFVTYFVLSCISCGNKTKEDVFLEINNKNTANGRAFDHNYKEGWYVPDCNYEIDSLNTERRSNILLLTPSTKNGSVNANYYVDLESVQGGKMTFSGKYKYSGASNSIIQFTIRQYSNSTGKTVFNLAQHNCLGDSEWLPFSLTTVFDDNVSGGTFDIGTMEGCINKLWIKDCEIKIDNQPLCLANKKQVFGADTDTKFDKGSNIKLPALTPQITDNLEVLGKVWGFLKYYHPQVIQGSYNWDYELFRILPQVANANNDEERNKLLYKWINTFGKIKESQNYAIQDTSLYSRLIDLQWIGDERKLGKALSSKLQEIKDAKRNNRFNYYLINYYLHKGDYIFGREKAYSYIQWDDEGYRLLNLFRIWNAIEYCFPYTDLTDRPWKSVLKEYIPRFAKPSNKSDYEMAIAELTANINDSHGSVTEANAPKNSMPRSLPIESEDLRGTELERKIYRNALSVKLVVAKNGEIVVQSSQCDELEQGDIILKVDGENVDEIIHKMSPYFNASNIDRQKSLILPYILKSENIFMLIEFVRDGVRIEKKVSTYGQNIQKKEKHATPESYNLNSKNILYIDVSDKLNNLNEIMETIGIDTTIKGIIFDMRKYPGQHLFDFFQYIELSRRRIYLVFCEY